MMCRGVNFSVKFDPYELLLIDACHFIYAYYKMSSESTWEFLVNNVGIPDANLEMDRRCKEIFDTMQDIASVYDNDRALDERVRALKPTWLPAQDQYGRSLLHLTALAGNTRLVRSLVNCGAVLNKMDGIGQTPLTLSLYKGYTNTSRFLITVSTADDLCDVGQLGVSPADLVKEKDRALEGLVLKKISEYHALVDKLKIDFPVEEGDEMEYDTNSDTYEHRVNYARALNINVGDQKNTVTLQGCENRCPDQYSVHVPGGGDFHNRGYINESIARIAGQGGFWHATEHIMKRPTVNPMSFKKKFKDNNYNNNEEALIDYDDGLSIAMIKKFQESDVFPTERELHNCKIMTGSHNSILLKRLQKWIRDNKSSDAVFSYHSTFVNDLMPITRWCKESTRYGNGLSMEGVWMLLPQLYVQVGKTNYRDEAFTQCVNSIAHLPLAYRKMYQQNRSVNVDGKQGRQLAGDEWVESYLVRPVKQYANAQSSFAMVELMSCSVNLLEMNRNMYKGHQAFDIHNTRKHQKPSSLYDCLRIAQFALKEKWFASGCKRDKIAKYAWATTTCKPGDSVQSQYVDPLTKGDTKAEKEFVPFLHRKYPNQMA